MNWTKKLGALMLIAVMAMLPTYWPVVRAQAKIWYFDVRFARVQIGDRATKLDSILGKPDAVIEFPMQFDQEHGFRQINEYRVHLGRYPAVKWSVRLDSSGRVILKDRDNGGC